jgi:hypothetical protein
MCGGTSLFQCVPHCALTLWKYNTSRLTPSSRRCIKGLGPTFDRAFSTRCSSAQGRLPCQQRSRCLTPDDAAIVATGNPRDGQNMHPLLGRDQLRSKVLTNMKGMLTWMYCPIARHAMIVCRSSCSALGGALSHNTNTASQLSTCVRAKSCKTSNASNWSECGSTHHATSR